MQSMDSFVNSVFVGVNSCFSGSNMVGRQVNKAIMLVACTEQVKLGSASKKIAESVYFQGFMWSPPKLYQILA